MHNTRVKTKDGKEYNGSINTFRPAFNWFTLFGIDRKFSFDECESVITSGQRLSVNQIGDCDEIERAKNILDDGRKYNWTETDEDGNVKPYPKEEFEWEKEVGKAKCCKCKGTKFTLLKVGTPGKIKCLNCGNLEDILKNEETN